MKIVDILNVNICCRQFVTFSYIIRLLSQMSYLLFSSGGKNMRTPSTFGINPNLQKSSNSNYEYGSSLQKKPPILNSINQPTITQPKSSIRQYANMVSSEKLQNNKDIYNDIENRSKQSRDKNFRIRDSNKKTQSSTIRINEEEERKKLMEESIKRKEKEREEERIRNIEKEKQSLIRKMEAEEYKSNNRSDSKILLRKDYSSLKTSGLVGLNNIGNTCFMNSILQCMFNIPDFNEYFIDNQYKRQAKSGSRVAATYAKTIQAIRSSSSRSQTPSELKSAIGSKRQRFSGYAQQDAQQFLAGLLELLSSDLNRSGKPKYREMKADLGKNTLAEISEEWWKYNLEREDSIVCDYFSGQMLSRVICSKCDTQSIAFDNMWDIALNFSNDDRGDILNMFKNFLKKEVISDDYYCNKCKGFKECTRKLDFYRLPKVLVCQIKRFSYGRWKKVKLNNRVKISLELDLGSLITQSRHHSVKYPVYELIGVVNHSGDIDFGHYTAQCQNPFNKKWYNFNDSSVSQINKRQQFQSSSPYLLFYYKKE